MTLAALALLLLTFHPQEGKLTLEARGSDATVVSATEIPGLWMDGVFQQGFQKVSEGRWRNSGGDLSVETIAGGSIAVTFSPRDGRPHEFRLRIRSDDETEYYGAGERFQALNQRGYVLPMRVDDRYGNKGVGSHKPIPFFISSRGFGVWLDSFAPAMFDLSGTERFNTDLTLSDRSLRVVFIAGPTPAEILKNWTALTGRSPVPPPWAFGLWKSRDVHKNREEVLEDVEKLRRFGIPASVIVLDSPWETGYNDFEINRRQFTDPESMLARIEALGFHLALWLTPFVNSKNVIDMEGISESSKNFAEATPHLVRDAAGNVALSDWWKGKGGLIDFTNPAAKEWWFSQLRKTKVYGTRAFKCDDGEGNFVPDALFHDGTPAAAMKNRYSLLYDRAMQEYIDRELNGDGVLIVRSGYTGMQRYPFAWAGDNRADFSFSDGLPSVLLAAQNAALSGISLWGSDIAGYAGTPDKELFIRWTQFAVFCPFMQIHMTSNLGPWDFDTETLEIFRRYAVLRSQLFPYLYDAVHESARSGMPVIRPMVLAFPDDRDARAQIDQFLFGPDLLVAPMYQRGTRRSVYFPKGIWFDYWSGARHEGPKSMEVEAPLGRIPLFVREGAIIPKLPPDVQTLVARHQRMDPDVVSVDARRIVEVWPGRGRGVTTWDGLSARVEDETLRVTSKTARPIEVHFAPGGPVMKLESRLKETRVPLPAALRVMTFNIRLNLASDGLNAWPRRKEAVAALIRLHDVDLVGLQEALPEQLVDLDALLPHLARFGSGRSAERLGEFSAVYYRKDRFELLDSDTFWLSETPSIPGSKGWDAAYERIATWGKLRDRRTGSVFFHFNTHLDHIGRQARREGARLIMRTIAQIAGGDTPVILTGDFNDVPGSEAYRIVTERGFQDARDVTRCPAHGPDSTWNGFKAIEPGRRIDFVFVRGVPAILQHAILSDTLEGRFPSDHLPVVAELQLAPVNEAVAWPCGDIITEWSISSRSIGRR